MSLQIRAVEDSAVFLVYAPGPGPRPAMPSFQVIGKALRGAGEGEAATGKSSRNRGPISSSAGMTRGNATYRLTVTFS
jgi:hypothetical protein